MTSSDEFNIAGHCAECDLNIVISKARFCPYCGEELQPPSSNVVQEAKLQKATKLDEKPTNSERGRTCMICHETPGKDDFLAWCPFCGYAAHRVELTKWLRDKQSCPSCGERLTEKQLEEAAKVRIAIQPSVGPITRTIVHRGHTIGIEVSTSGTQKILYDGKEVSSGGGRSTTMCRHTFSTEEDGKAVQYDVRVDSQSSGGGGFYPGKGLAGIIVGAARLAIAASRPLYWIKTAILRNARFVYNDGIVIFPGSETMRSIRAELKQKGIEPEEEIDHCPNCGAEITILDPGFCACCGNELQNGYGYAASAAAGSRAVNKDSHVCTVCDGSLGGYLKKDNTVTWCPFCGAAAHARCLLDSLKDNAKCPSCSNTLFEKDLANQLKKRSQVTAVTQVHAVKPKRLNLCMVCGGGVYEGDPIALCPHCRGMAHRDDFLEYVHVKGSCPSCGQRVNERELLEQN